MTTRTIARREAIGRLALGGLGIAAAPVWLEALTSRAIEHAEGWVAQPAAAAWKPKALTAHQAETVATVAERIIPQTETVGARAARVHEFIDEVLRDDEPATRDRFLNGLSWIDQRSRSRYGADFVKASPEQQVGILTALSEPGDTSAPDVARDFFSVMKSLTITGYYTSEIGMKEELDDDGGVFFEVYKGCTDPGHGYEPAQ